MNAPRPGIALLLLLIATVVVSGCGGPRTLTQRLAGEWRGRPESSAERTRREWPGDAAGLADEEAAEPTELEALADLRVRLDLNLDGSAALRLDGRDGADLRGEWSVEAGEGRRAFLEIAVERTDPAPVGDVTPAGGATTTERRRFAVQLLSGGDRFVLSEEGADQRFGRLLFTRVGSETGATADPVTE